MKLNTHWIFLFTFKSGKIATHFDLVSHNVRTQLDELKRHEVERLTTLIARKTKLMKSNQAYLNFK